MQLYFVYVLKSFKDGMFYTGFTSNLKKRILEHNTGEVKSTINRRPLKLIYFVRRTPTERLLLIKKTHYIVNLISKQHMVNVISKTD